MPRLIPFLFSFGSTWAPLRGRIYVGLLPGRKLQAQARGCVIICHLPGSPCGCLSVALPSHLQSPCALNSSLLSEQDNSSSDPSGPQGVSLSFSNARQGRLSRQALSKERGRSLGFDSSALSTEPLLGLWELSLGAPSGMQGSHAVPRWPSTFVCEHMLCAVF